MDKEAREKLDSLAKEYLSQCPNLVHSYEEAWEFWTNLFKALKIDASLLTSENGDEK